MNFISVDGLPLFPLEEIIDRSPIIVEPDISLQEVFVLMKQTKEARKEADCVLIATEKQLAGMFTIREAVDFFALGIDRMSVPISAVMNSQIPTLTLSETSLTLEELNYFCRLEIPYLPVLSTEKKLVGLLTLKKLSAHLPSFVTECDLQGQVNQQLEANMRQKNQELAEALKKLEIYAERLTLALEGANVGLWDWDITTNRVYWTPQHEEIFGYETGNTTRTYEDWRCRVHPDDIEQIEREINSLNLNKTEYRFKYRIIWPDGSLHWIEGLGRFSFDENGQGLRAIGIVYDITEQVLVEQSLRESEERLRTIFDYNFFGVAYGDIDGKVTGGNDEYLRIIGYSREDLASIPLYCHEITPPEYSSLDREKLGEVSNRGACTPYEKEYIRPDGTRVPVVLGYGLVAPGRREMVGFVLDLSPVKAAEKSLRISEERLKALFDANVIGLSIGDVYGTIKEGNEEYLRIIGYKKEDIGVGKLQWMDITSPEYLSRDLEGIVEAKARGACTPYEKEYIRPDGSRIPALIGYGLVGEKKEEIVCFVLDLSGIKEAEKSLRISEERLRTLFTANVIGIVYGDTSGGLKEVNEEYLRIIGYSHEDVASGRLRWTDITPEEYLSLDWQAREEAKISGGCTPYEKEYIRPDSSRVPVLVGFGLVDENQEEAVAIVLDLTPVKQAERQMQSLNEALTESSQLLAKRNQELERFAYVVSHDLKAPLRAIANLSQWLEEDLDGNLTQETRYNMQLLRQRVYRLSAMIEALLDYSRIGLISVQEETVSVTELLQEIVESLVIPPNFIIEVKSPLPTFSTKRLFLSQVFYNLISNAIKHHHHSQVHIEIKSIDRGNYYEFSVKDNGPGIALEYQERIFDIFQILTRRDQTENTGIGLSIVKKIIDNQGERIWLDSREGEGATFYFTWHKNPTD
jgi:PAS domain S-box-containing protein